MSQFTLHETSGKFDLATATKIANSWSKGKLLHSKLPFERMYYTAIRSTPDKVSPELCWIVTNRLDPRVGV